MRSTARFCNADALCAVIFVKGALSFQRGRRETSCVRVPHDLAQLQRAILSSFIGLSSPGLIFAGGECADVAIAKREEQLLCHCALLAAVASENELLDCILSFDWEQTAKVPQPSRDAEAAATLKPLVPLLAAHLCVMAQSTQLTLPHLEDAAANYLRQLKLRCPGARNAKISVLSGNYNQERSTIRKALGFELKASHVSFHLPVYNTFPQMLGPAF